MNWVPIEPRKDSMNVKRSLRWYALYERTTSKCLRNLRGGRKQPDVLWVLRSTVVCIRHSSSAK